MSWNGTVRCSHCYQTGHNKRGCPQLKEEIERRRAEFGDDDWKVRSHDSHRRWTSRKGETRRCTYCGEIGHNRRTCPTLGGHVEQMQKASVVFRRRFVDALQASGVGVGSLLVHNSYWNDGKTRYLVTGINWGAVSAFSRREGVGIYKVRNLANLTAGESLCPAWENLMPTIGTSSVTVLAPKNDIEVPDDFLAGLTVKEAKAMLKESEAWNWEHSSFTERIALYADEPSAS